MGAGRRRASLGALVAAVTVLVAGVLLTGVGSAATPGLVRAAEPVVGSLLGGPRDTAPADPDDPAPEQGLPVPPLPACLPTARACVDLANEQAWLLDTGRVVRGPVDVIPGSPDTPTPRGLFKVQWKAAEYTSREYLVQMPWSVFFAPGGIAFHEGSPDTYSAGCVKLSPEDAKAFFDFLQVGDQVQIR
jgi:hypothetical protein